MENLGGSPDLVVINPFTSDGLLCAVVLKVFSDDVKIVTVHEFDPSMATKKKVLIISSLPHEQFVWSESVVYILENREHRKSVCQKMPSTRKVPLTPMALYRDRYAYEMVFDFLFAGRNMQLPQFFVDFKNNFNLLDKIIRSNFTLHTLNELALYCSGDHGRLKSSIISFDDVINQHESRTFMYRTSSIVFVKTVLSTLHPEVYRRYCQGVGKAVVFTELSLVPKTLLVTLIGGGTLNESLLRMQVSSGTPSIPYFLTSTPTMLTFIMSRKTFKKAFSFDP